MAKRHNLATAAPETDWRTEQDLSTLLEAERISKDPKRLAAAQKLAKTKVMPLAAIANEGDGKS